MSPGAVLQVAGQSEFFGGRLANAGGTLDLNGGARFEWRLPPPIVPITNPPRILCAGNWVADAQFFAPTAGTVELDGAATTTIDGISGSPRRIARFFDLEIRNGTREPAGNLTLAIGGTATVRDTGRVRTGTREIVGQPIRGVIRDGQLLVSAGGRLLLDANSTIDVETTGSLRLDGTSAEPAWIVNEGPPGWQLRVRGGMDALYFVLAGMGPSGVRVFPGASLGQPPYDFRMGVLLAGSPGGALLDLDLAPGAPMRTLRYLMFDNGGAAARHNVRARNTTRPPDTRIRVVNAIGGFAGGVFEDDPNDVISWSSAQTTLSVPFRAVGRLGRIDLGFTTAEEDDDGVFRISVSSDPRGPFYEIPQSPVVPRGGPRTYMVSHVGNLAPLARYHYRLEQELPHGPRIPLGESSARPMPRQVGISAFVGPGGFSDIPSAVTAAGPGGYVVVSPGTYPAFTITQPTHVMGDGSGGAVIIDTTLGPVTISGVPRSAGDVSLFGLRIGPSAAAGIRVINCACPVVLDHCDVSVVNGTAVVHVDASPQVAVQGCVLAGGSGLRVSNGSVAYVAAGSLTALTVEAGSLVKHVAVGGFTTVVDGSSIVRRLDGTMPNLDFDLLAVSEQASAVRFRGDPGRLFALQAAASKFFFDLTLVQGTIDMVLLLGLFPNVTLGTGVLDGAGVGLMAIPIPPLVDLWGMGLPLQAVVLDPVSLSGRWSNVRDMLIVP